MQMHSGFDSMTTSYPEDHKDHPNNKIQTLEKENKELEQKIEEIKKTTIKNKISNLFKF